jgi:hypothetical protein
MVFRCGQCSDKNKRSGRQVGLAFLGQARVVRDSGRDWLTIRGVVTGHALLARPRAWDEDVVNATFGIPVRLGCHRSATELPHTPEPAQQMLLMQPLPSRRPGDASVGWLRWNTRCQKHGAPSRAPGRRGGSWTVRTKMARDGTLQVRRASCGHPRAAQLSVSAERAHQALFADTTSVARAR